MLIKVVIGGCGLVAPLLGVVACASSRGVDASHANATGDSMPNTAVSYEADAVLATLSPPTADEKTAADIAYELQPLGCTAKESDGNPTELATAPPKVQLDCTVSKETVRIEEYVHPDEIISNLRITATIYCRVLRDLGANSLYLVLGHTWIVYGPTLPTTQRLARAIGTGKLTVVPLHC
jgi:hypothetical protein